MKKGFTLIELLAVIVILAIIALIAVPIVLNIINDSKESSLLRSAEFYLDAAEYTIADAFLYHGGLEDGTYPITPDGDICKVALANNECSKENTLKVEVNGKKTTGGSITIANGNIEDVEIILSEKTIIKNPDGELVYLEDNGNKILPNSLAAKILENYGGIDAITEVEDFSVVNSGLYKAEDDYGTSYYFRGNVIDNYVSFGSYSDNSFSYLLFDPNSPKDTIRGSYSTQEECQTEIDAGNQPPWFVCEAKGHKVGDPIFWRIVRVNGDGSIKLIYSGERIVQNGLSNESIIDMSACFDNSKIGYTYTYNGEQKSS